MRKLFKKSLACVLAVALCLTAMVGAMVVSADVVGTLTVEGYAGTVGTATAEDLAVTATFAAPENELISESFIDVAVVDAEGNTVAVESVALTNAASEDDTVALNTAKTRFNIASDAGMATAIVKIVIAADPAVAGTYTVTLTDVTSATDSQSLITFAPASANVVLEEPVVEHVHAPAEAVVENNVPATCYSEGSYDSVVYCTAEGCDLENKVISSTHVVVPVTDHTPAEPVEENRVEPDCDTAGSYDSVVYCSVAECKHEISRTTVTIDALGHTDDNQDGICDICGYENLDETLTFYNKAMLLGADIRGIFQVRKYKATSPYASFKVIAEKVDGTVSELELVATSDKTNHTTYGYAITVPAKEMADIISARIVGITAEGEAFTSNVETWSIKAGLVATMDGAATAAVGGNEAAVNTMNLAANMLNYGAEAQKYFHYKEESLATDGLSEEYAAYIITEKPAMETISNVVDPNAVVPFKDVVFNLGARVELLVRFTVPKSDSKDDYSAMITQIHTAPDGTETSEDYTIEGANCIKSGTTFAVYLKDFASNELRDVLKVTLYKNGVAVSAEQTVSAESSLNGLYNTYPSMVTALMNYGDCARAYFG